MHRGINAKYEGEVSKDVNNVATNLYCQSYQIEFTLYYDKFGPLHKLFKNKERRSFKGEETSLVNKSEEEMIYRN